MLLSRSEPIGGVQGMASNFFKIGACVTRDVPYN